MVAAVELERARASQSEAETSQPAQHGCQTTAEDVCGPSFEAFWALYPLKTSFAKAAKVWTKLKPAIRRKAMAALQTQLPSLTRDESCPSAARWLNGKRYDAPDVLNRDIGKSPPAYTLARQDKADKLLYQPPDMSENEYADKIRYLAAKGRITPESARLVGVEIEEVRMAA